MDAKDTVVSILQELDFDIDPKGNARSSLSQILKQRDVSVVNWTGFQNIDKKETSSDRKRSENQPREKLTEIGAMLEAAQT